MAIQITPPGSSRQAAQAVPPAPLHSNLSTDEFRDGLASHPEATLDSNRCCFLNFLDTLCEKISSFFKWIFRCADATPEADLIPPQASPLDIPNDGRDHKHSEGTVRCVSLPATPPAATVQVEDDDDGKDCLDLLQPQAEKEQAPRPATVQVQDDDDMDCLDALRLQDEKEKELRPAQPLIIPQPLQILPSAPPSDLVQAEPAIPDEGPDALDLVEAQNAGVASLPCPPSSPLPASAPPVEEVQVAPEPVAPVRPTWKDTPATLALCARIKNDCLMNFGKAFGHNFEARTIIEQVYQPLLEELTEKNLITVGKPVDLLKLSFIPEALHKDGFLNCYQCAINATPIRFAMDDPTAMGNLRDKTLAKDDGKRAQGSYKTKYEKATIEEWLRKNPTSPTTSQSLTVADLIPSKYQVTIDRCLKLHGEILTALIKQGMCSIDAAK